MDVVFSLRYSDFRTLHFQNKRYNLYNFYCLFRNRHKRNLYHFCRLHNSDWILHRDLVQTHVYSFDCFTVFITCQIHSVSKAEDCHNSDYFFVHFFCNHRFIIECKPLDDLYIPPQKFTRHNLYFSNKKVFLIDNEFYLCCNVNFPDFHLTEHSREDYSFTYSFLCFIVSEQVYCHFFTFDKYLVEHVWSYCTNNHSRFQRFFVILTSPNPWHALMFLVLNITCNQWV